MSSSILHRGGDSPDPAKLSEDVEGAGISTHAIQQFQTQASISGSQTADELSTLLGRQRVAQDTDCYVDGVEHSFPKHLGT